ncbi:Calcineurin-like phosphoesterase superfamily domain-containing protein [Zhouia amylolytica]|uniref:Calcineurin-like phosphoesterase superfamily domain-containing protein n=2 Tax=Zhouia amylolytica TaxID=376730 RepID=A0A1I6P4W2_9FLAO|nr:Calcineurin-like phosphoesterase superfamily domain-containing protein [Zhouia amylolytica]
MKSAIFKCFSIDIACMATKHRLTNAFSNAKKITFNDQSKFILFSDCHRGDNSYADDFANNRNIYFYALNQYYKNDFTYIELGDGDELWENLSFESIFKSHKHIYLLLKNFYEKSRLFMIYGNHDMVYKNKDTVAKNYDHYFDPVTGTKVPLLPNINFHESIVLEHEVTKQKIFLIHGHQADWWNFGFWRLSRLMVRILWKPLQIIGIADPTSPAKNYKELIKIERRIKRWIVEKNNQLTIAGHTHRPRFPEPGQIPFFNDGSCVHPRSITGLEIENGNITLIKWYTDITEDGYLRIVRTVLEGPRKLKNYLIKKDV